MTQECVPLSDWRNVIHEDVVADGLEVEEDAVEEAERQERSIICQLEQNAVLYVDGSRKHQSVASN